MPNSDFEFTQSETFGLTDIGQKRAVNQDQFLIAELSKSMLVSASSLSDVGAGRFFGDPQGTVLLVADGMGGHAAGEKASSLALEHLIARLLNSVHWFFQSDAYSEDDFVDSLKELLQDAHGRIQEESRADHTAHGMGTTLTMAYISWPVMYVVHAGDSRCYLVRDGEAQQLTTDHTLARQMVEAGGMSPEDEATSRWSNVLWNVLGGNNKNDLVAEVRKVNLLQGDRVLLCSDGLYRYLDAKQIAHAFNKQPDASILCRQLIDAANQLGGEDNITAIASSPRPRPESSADGDDIVHDRALSETWTGTETGEISS